MTNHTPGPWVANYYTDDTPCYRCDGAVHIAAIETVDKLTDVIWAGYVGEDEVVKVRPDDLALILSAPTTLAAQRELIAALAGALAEYAKDENWGDVYGGPSGGDFEYPSGVWYGLNSDGENEPGYSIARAALALANQPAPR